MRRWGVRTRATREHREGAAIVKKRYDFAALDAVRLAGPRPERLPPAAAEQGRQGRQVSRRRARAAADDPCAGVDQPLGALGPGVGLGRDVVDDDARLVDR